MDTSEDELGQNPGQVPDTDEHVQRQAVLDVFEEDGLVG
jgi:hypothetical protein